MTVYVALLRGINVGGKNIIKMAALKEAFEAIGLSKVKTYIQSGNVLFISNEEEEILCNKIEHEIQTVFGITTKIILRTADELEQIIFNCPFTEEEIKEAEQLSEVESLYVALLPLKLNEENIQRIEPYRNKGDNYEIIGRDVYLLFQHSIRNSKLAGNLNKLELPSTVRNWKTLRKLSELAKAMDINK
jgi:uncharacterized protein (DUF1697 family)